MPQIRRPTTLMRKPLIRGRHTQLRNRVRRIHSPVLGLLNVSSRQPDEPVVPVVILRLQDRSALLRSRGPLPQRALGWLQWWPADQAALSQCVSLTRVRALKEGGFEAEARLLR